MVKASIVFWVLLGVLVSGISIAWLGAFLANAPSLPVTVDGPQRVGLLEAIAMDLALLILFGLQHSVMPRPMVKQRIEQAFHPAAARGLYNVASGVVLMMLVAFWQPIDGVIWTVQGPAAWVFHLMCALGLVLSGLAVLVIGGGELLGLPQAMAALRGDDPFEDSFRTPWIYRIVRHPMQLGIVLMLFGTPEMTAGHLLFSAGLTVYIWIGVTLEERGLVDAFGDAYRAYQKEVPKLFPKVRR